MTDEQPLKIAVVGNDVSYRNQVCQKFRDQGHEAIAYASQNIEGILKETDWRHDAYISLGTTEHNAVLQARLADGTQLYQTIAPSKADLDQPDFTKRPTVGTLAGILYDNPSAKELRPGDLDAAITQTIYTIQPPTIKRANHAHQQPEGN